MNMYPWYRDSVGGQLGQLCGPMATTIKTENGYNDCMLALDYATQSKDNEDILLFASDVSLQWSGQFHGPFHGTKNGFLYLTNERLIFINKAQKDLMLTFSFPYESLEEVELSQPGLGPNYLKGRVVAEPEGNWTGAANFKLIFKNGGALEFAKCMLQCSKTPVSASAASNEDLYEAPSFSLPLEVPLDYNLNDIQSSLSL